MANKYSVVQYTPDPIANERINVGVLVFSPDNVHARFLNNWRRVRNFGGEDVGFLKRFADGVARALKGEQMLDGMGGTISLTGEIVEEMAGQWSHAIQLTPPKSSLKDAEELLEFLTKQFLVEPEKQKRPRPKQTAARIAAEQIEGALLREIGETAKDLIRRSYPVGGEVEAHEFDLVLANGRPFMATEGFSFEAAETSRLVKNFEATAYAIEDVRQANPEIPLAVVALPPPGESELFVRAQEVFRKLEAELVMEDEVDEWAPRTAEDVKSRLAVA